MFPSCAFVVKFFIMKKQFLSFLLILTFVFSVSAQKAKQSKEEKRLRTHVSYLASEKLEGRRTGEKGAIFAAGYVSNMFARYKLKAGMAQNNGKGKSKQSYLQKFPYVSGIEIGADNSLLVNDSKINLKTDWMPIVFSPNAKIENLPVVFAGFGIDSDELKYNDYRNIEANGKIVLAFETTPDNDNPHGEFSRFDFRAKANIAKAKGAKALLIISDEENFADEKLAQMNFNQTLGETAIPTIVISRRTAGKFLEMDEKNLRETEEWLAKRVDAPENIRIRIADLPKMSAQMNLNLVQKQAEAYNVIGIIPGRDAVLKNEAIVIGAHYDHLGRGGDGSLDVNSKQIHHGADDNASGVAALLELAQQFRKAEKNKRTLIFIAFGGEEEGLLGSKYYVNNPVFPIEKTAAMINMDMVGRLDKENKLIIGGIGTASEWNQLIESEQPRELGNMKVVKGNKNFPTKDAAMSVGANGDVMVTKSADRNFFDLQLNQDGFGPSDHSSFYGKQIPVLFFFTGTHTDYHKPTDTAEKINYRGLEKITEFVSEIVRSIDRNPLRPTYAKAQSSGMSGENRRGFNVSLGTVPSYADNTNDGLLLDGVRDDSPAAKAGLLAGDKIIKMAGNDVRNISDYVFVLGEMKAGEEYEVIVMRGAEKMILKIVPDARK